MILRGEIDFYVFFFGKSVFKDWDMVVLEVVLFVVGGCFIYVDQIDFSYNIGDVCQVGCLIVSYGKVYVEFGECVMWVMVEIDFGFQV